MGIAVAKPFPRLIGQGAGKDQARPVPFRIGITVRLKQIPFRVSHGMGQQMPHAHPPKPVVESGGELRLQIGQDGILQRQQSLIAGYAYGGGGEAFGDGVAVETSGGGTKDGLLPQGASHQH